MITANNAEIGSIKLTKITGELEISKYQKMEKLNFYGLILLIIQKTKQR